MTARLPGGYNTYIPSFEASGQVISMTRDTESFKLPQYVQYVTTKKDVGFYLKLDIDQPARVVDDSDHVWEDGQDAPTGTDNLGNFEYVQYRTKRRAYAFNLGNKAVEQADWKILASQAAIVAQQAMTNRTARVATLLTTSSNWPAANTSDANALNGGLGKFSLGSDDPTSANYLAIKVGLMAAVRNIAAATNGLVQFKDLVWVMNDNMAMALANTAEMHNYVKNTPFAKAQRDGTEPNPNVAWGLPSHVYGIEVVIEDAWRVTSRPGATVTRALCWPDATSVLISRKGGLEGQYGLPSYSTVQLHFYEEMTVESKYDPDNRRHAGRVVEDFIELLVAGPAGYMISNCI